MTGRKKLLSPEVAQRLGVMATEIRELLWDGDGIPEWGTLFSEIEDNGMCVGHELARLIMEQAVSGQAESPVPAKHLVSDEETAAVCRTDQTVLQTPAGSVHWDQPQARLAQQRRDFFPSGEGAGD